MGKYENLLRQKNGVHGNYRKYMLNLYNYIADKIENSDTDYCITNVREMIEAVYEGNPDHMAFDMVRGFKKDLSKLGYIKNIKMGDEWRTYILKEADF